MTVDWTAEVLDQAETYWTYQLRPRLDGLTDAEYFWSPAPGAWTISRRGESTAPLSLGAGDFTWDFGEPQVPEPVTTIAWRLGHLVVNFASMNGTHFGGPVVDADTHAYAGTAADALHQLDHHFAAWVDGVRRRGSTGSPVRRGS